MIKNKTRNEPEVMLPQEVELTDPPCSLETEEDITLIRWMLSLTPLERLRVAQNSANSLSRLQNAKRHF